MNTPRPTPPSSPDPAPLGSSERQLLTVPPAFSIGRVTGGMFAPGVALVSFHKSRALVSELLSLGFIEDTPPAGALALLHRAADGAVVTFERHGQQVTAASQRRDRDFWFLLGWEAWKLNTGHSRDDME